VPLRKLALVADALSGNRDCEAFIVFSKTGQFSSDEVERCKAAQEEYERRVILLSNRELEPNFVYERTEKEFEVRRFASSLQDMAQATWFVYFDPKPKRPTQPTGVANASEPPTPTGCLCCYRW